MQIEREMKDFLQRAASTQTFFTEEIQKGAAHILREYEESLKVEKLGPFRDSNCFIL